MLFVHSHPVRNTPLSRFLLSVLIGCLTVSGYAQKPPVKFDPEPTTWLPAPSPAEGRIWAELAQRGEIRFVGTPLSDAIDFLTDLSGIPMQLDLQAPVTLEKDNISLREMLSSILSQQNLTYVIENGAVKFVSVAADRGRFLTRTYPVADLVEKTEQAALIKSMKDAVGADGWKDKSGGSIETDPKAQSVTIRQTFSAHEKIIGFLEDRRLAIAKQKK